MESILCFSLAFKETFVLRNGRTSKYYRKSHIQKHWNGSMRYSCQMRIIQRNPIKSFPLPLYLVCSSWLIDGGQTLHWRHTFSFFVLPPLVVRPGRSFERTAGQERTPHSPRQVSHITRRCFICFLTPYHTCISKCSQFVMSNS